MVGRTIALIIQNGKLGLATEKYLDRWTIDCSMSSWCLKEEGFVPILNLRKKADLSLHTADEIIKRHGISIMNALRKKAVSLTKENQRLRIDVSTSRFRKK